MECIQQGKSCVSEPNKKIINKKEINTRYHITDIVTNQHGLRSGREE